ncbi:hypothetical protein DR64_8701 [Paraburkholderia xenovorans LB400]|nr:hypothetical protein DR64_8701 [Paraburkholderia xenovorans LB400]
MGLANAIKGLPAVADRVLVSQADAPVPVRTLRGVVPMFDRNWQTVSTARVPG